MSKSKMILRIFDLHFTKDVYKNLKHIAIYNGYSLTRV